MYICIHTMKVSNSCIRMIRWFHFYFSGMRLYEVLHDPYDMFCFVFFGILHPPLQSCSCLYYIRIRIRVYTRYAIILEFVMSPRTGFFVMSNVRTTNLTRNLLLVQNDSNNYCYCGWSRVRVLRPY